MQRRSGAYALAALVVLLLVAASVWYVAADGKSLPRCAPRQAHVLASNGEAQVYQQRDAASRAGAIHGSAIVFGCVRGVRGRSSAYTLGSAALGSRMEPVSVSRETLAGPIVAYERHFTPLVGPESSLIVVRDLRTGRLLHSAPAETPGTPRPNLAPMRIAAIVLKGDGSVAWIVETGNDSVPYYQLHAIDRSGSRVLANAYSIEPRSLALSEDFLTWSQGGALERGGLMSAGLN
jgi:hypothetical protein